MSNEQIIWNYLKKQGINDKGCAGILGNLYAESGLNPINLQNSFEKKLGMTDKEYTKAVDEGKYTNFTIDGAGYGLAQWTYSTRKQGLLKFAKQLNKSIGDLELQIQYLYIELSSMADFPTNIKNASSIKQASDFILLRYERPSDQSEEMKARRLSYSQNYYNQFTVPVMNTSIQTINETETEIRSRVVKRAQSWINYNENDNSYKTIIDIYNTQNPLPVGYKVKYNDPWCATFNSAVAVAEQLTDIIPTECSCSRMIALFKKLNAWIEEDNYSPQPGDFIFYDWQDDGKGDNQGSPDHVGIVVENDGKAIKVIEGNINNKVDYHNILINNKFIRGYGVPLYSKKAGKKESLKPIETPNEEIYIVKKGDTLSSIAKQYNTTYQELAKYNNIANPNFIQIGQKIRIPKQKEKISSTPTTIEPNIIITKNPYIMPLFTIKLGARGQTVKWVQFALYKAGYGTGSLNSFVNGNFDNRTKEAIIKFQKHNHLPVTGIIDASTRAVLKKVN